MAELTRTVNHLRAEQAQLDQARMDFQVRDPDCMLRGVDPQSQLDNLQNELNEERSRSMRFERSWQQAEDRAAASQFELARANAELDKLRQGQ
jgi:bHLH factor